ncbi:hypothetical protein F0U59_50580 [Archangium gephyra]|nr:hypothetical protein F0U59_50580 [Archangium gephyra]
MKHVFVALAAVVMLVSGCGPAEGTEEMGTESSSVEQKLTPCLSDCYGYCSSTSTTSAEVMACRADCRVACEGVY